MTKINSVLSWRLLLPIVAVLALALLAACGGAATEAPEPTATSAPAAPAPTTASAAQPTAAPAQPTAVPTTAPAATTAPSSGGQAQGQLTLGLTGYGNEVPIPWQEIAFAKNYGRFIWDYLIGTTDDAQLSTETGLATSWAMSEDGLS